MGFSTMVKSVGISSNAICIELVRSKRSNVERVNVLDAIKALMRVCSDVKVDILTSVSKHGYKTILMLASDKEDVIRCKNLLKMFLAVYLTDGIEIEERQCSKLVGFIPL